MYYIIIIIIKKTGRVDQSLPKYNGVLRFCVLQTSENMTGCNKHGILALLLNHFTIIIFLADHQGRHLFISISHSFLNLGIFWARQVFK